MRSMVSDDNWFIGGEESYMKGGERRKNTVVVRALHQMKKVGPNSLSRRLSIGGEAKVSFSARRGSFAPAATVVPQIGSA